MKKNRAIYYTLLGFVLFFIAFIIFIWFDTQKINNSLSMKPADMRVEEKIDTKIEINQEDLTLASISEANQQKADNIEYKMDSSVQSERNETPVEIPKGLFKVKNDDWRYEKGEEIDIKTEPNANKASVASE